MSVRPRKWITRSGEERKAWVVDYKDRAGKRHIETFSLKKQAEARRKVIEDELDTGSHVPRRESITVEAAAKLWLDAKKKGLPVLAFSARDGGRLREIADHSVIVPTDRTDRAQEIHLCIEHVICEIVERTL